MDRRSFLIGSAAACGALAFHPISNRAAHLSRKTTTTTTSTSTTTMPGSTDVYTAIYLSSY